MAGQTPWYNLAYFDFHDRLDYAINVSKEIDRFLTIDNQLYGLYSVFENGVVAGWEVFDNGFTEAGGISIGITIGQGIINYISAQTTITYLIENITASQTFNVYATLTGATAVTRSVVFVLDTSRPPSSILIAQITTSTNGIVSIDNTVREYISFEQIATDLIDSHKHRGTPPKVDLLSETKNELSSARIEGFDALKITTGRFDQDRSPVIAHSSLSEKGVMTHSELDSLADAIIDFNDSNNIVYKNLMGEVTSVNLLQSTIFLKNTYNNIDQFFSNEFIIMPGISPDSLSDSVNSTAFIDTTDNRIVGLPSGGGTTYFFTQNIELTSEIKNTILTSNKFVPEGSSVTFGINTTGSVDFSDYQVIDEETLSDIDYIGTDLRVGIKFIYSSPIGASDTNFEDVIEFIFVNDSLSSLNFHFRARWYTDAGFVNKFYEADSRTNQEGWILGTDISIPPEGYLFTADESETVSYYPDLSLFVPDQVYYLILDAWDGSSWGSEASGYTFFTSQGTSNPDPYSSLPQVSNFGLIFSLVNNSKVRINL